MPSTVIFFLFKSTYSNFTTLSAVTFIPRVPYFMANSNNLLKKKCFPHDCTYRYGNYMRQTPVGNLTSSATQEILHILSKLKSHYHVQNSLLLVLN